MDFPDLEELKKYLVDLRSLQVPSLTYYLSEDNLGFVHQPNRPGDPNPRQEASLASTATCIDSLIAAGEWGPALPLYTQTVPIADWLLSKNTSAQLPKFNPFSLSFAAEAAWHLADFAGLDQKRIKTEVKSRVVPHLKRHILEAKGSFGQVGAISIDPYPPSGYLTQLVFRVLQICGAADDDLRSKVHRWSRAEINKQIALISANSRVADPIQLAYSLVLAVTTSPDEETSPAEKEVFGYALRVFFDAQRPDGLWPPSQPMFHYKSVGSAYGFEYELLTQLLACEPLRDELLSHLPRLAKSAFALRTSAFDLRPGDKKRHWGWASGHHPQIKGPESWSTASVYHFALALDRLVAEAIRIALFKELRSIYPGAPTASQRPPSDYATLGFAADFLDADLNEPGETSPRSLRATLAQRFVYQIAEEASQVAAGGQLSDDTPMSAILFGPPGTSKTELAKVVSAYLGWPLLSVDPSYLVQDGVDRVQAMANRLFSMLTMTEQVVVLLDEFDEMGRDRTRNEDLLSRFITTAMLPKLAAINKERKLVFLLATNYVSGFDAAFSRGGRFDMMLQVMQPTLSEKLAHKKWQAALSAAMSAGAPDNHIADLTFLETKALVRRLEEVAAPQMAAETQKAWDACTLNRPNGPEASAPDVVEPAEQALLTSDAVGQAASDHETNASVLKKPVSTWRTTSQRDAKQIRLPPLPRRFSQAPPAP